MLSRRGGVITLMFQMSLSVPDCGCNCAHGILGEIQHLASPTHFPLHLANMGVTVN